MLYSDGGFVCLVAGVVCGYGVLLVGLVGVLFGLIAVAPGWWSIWLWLVWVGGLCLCLVVRFVFGGESDS